MTGRVSLSGRRNKRLPADIWGWEGERGGGWALILRMEKSGEFGVDNIRK